MATKEAAPTTKFSPFGKASKFTADQRVIDFADVSIAEDFNPRFEVSDLDELKSSIAKVGIISPPTVRPTDVEGKYVLVAGHRRFTAMVELGRSSSPFVIREDLVDEAKARAYAIAENSEDGRTNLTHVEMGSAFVKLMETEGWKNDKIAKETGVAKHTVRRCLKLMSLNSDILDMVQNGTLSTTAAIAFAKLDPAVQEQFDFTDLPDASAHQIKTMAQEAQRKIKAEAAEANKDDEGDGESDADSGRKKGKVKVLWRTVKERNDAIEQLAAVHDADSDDNDWSLELGVLYWLRGYGETIGDIKDKDFKALVKADRLKAEAKQAKEDAKDTE